MKAYITIGISGSGKSTWAKGHTTAEVVERDLIRSMLQDREDDQVDWTIWDFGNEEFVTELQDMAFRVCAFRKKDIVVSDTNLNPHFLGILEAKLQDIGFETERVIFDTPIEVCIERDAKRPFPVGEAVIRKQYEAFLRFINKEERT